MRTNKIITDIIVYVVLILGAVTMIYPFWWMLVASFNDRYTVTQVTFWVKEFAGGENYSFIFNKLLPGYGRSLINTLIYSTIPVLVGVVVSCAAAFAFAKMDFKGKNVVFMALLSAIMVPFPAIMFSQYVLFSGLNWLDGPITQILPKIFGGIMCIFFIRQFLSGLPTAIIESAKIDGATYPRIFIKMVLPLAMPAMVAQGLLGFMGSWNDYLGPMLMLQNIDWLPIAVSLANYSTANGIQANQGALMAGSVIAVAPVLILFGIFQKTIIASVMLSGSKE